MPSAATARAKTQDKIQVPQPHNWRTTDEDEVNRRRSRAESESFRIVNEDPSHPIFSTFRVGSGSGLHYSVEIRSLQQRKFACSCVDFQINGLGTCKHIEAVLLYLTARHRSIFRKAIPIASNRIEVVLDGAEGTLRVESETTRLPRELAGLFDRNGLLKTADVGEALDICRQSGNGLLRISQEVGPWLESRHRLQERHLLLREYEQRVQSGEWPQQETKVQLFPYQREGMLHLAFKERALLADEMGLGKTIQAIAACSLLHRLGKAGRVLVVTPASLKTEWEEQIQRFTDLSYRLVFGPRKARLASYGAPCFFTLVNYEQMLVDALDVNECLKPDVIVLDEAQRIKNWNTKTAQAIKRLKSRYAFVLTGTPIENRIDELFSIMGFLDPAVLGSLFRFNRDFYELDGRGRPCGYRNLDQLHARIKPLMLRRRKADVETELPERTDRNFLVPLSPGQADSYEAHAGQVAKLMSIASRRPLTQQEQDKLMRELAMMRMICDTNFILDPEDRVCPKLSELEKLLEECRDNPGVKVLVFSEWERMLELVRELCERLGLGYAYHSGSVPQKRRRAEILLFKQDPACRVFLTTDSGGTGLNLQNASVVINCDLPWNPARLEQRIARAWRKHQVRPVTVINLVSENTIEHRMLGTLASKQALADGVLDLKGSLDEIEFRGGRQQMIARLQQLVSSPPAPPATRPEPKVLPVDRALAFSQRASEKLGALLLRCEEHYPREGSHSVLIAVVERDAPLWQERLRSAYEELFGNGQSDPLAPVQFEVIDRVTADALQRLGEAGLLARSTRAVRSLHPSGEAADSQALTSEEQEKIRQHRQQAARKMKMVRLLVGGGMAEEAREPLSAAILSLGRALAAEQRLVEPEQASAVLAPPLAYRFGTHLSVLRKFLCSDEKPFDDVLSAVDTLLPSPAPEN